MIKYFVDEYGNIRSSDQETGNPCTFFLVSSFTDEVIIASRLTGNILYKFKAYNSPLELENKKE